MSKPATHKVTMLDVTKLPHVLLKEETAVGPRAANRLFKAYNEEVHICLIQRITRVTLSVL